MVVARRRYTAMRAALGRWRLRHCAPAVAALRFFSDLAERVLHFTSSTAESGAWYAQRQVFTHWAQFARVSAEQSAARCVGARPPLPHKHTYVWEVVLCWWEVLRVLGNAARCGAVRGVFEFWSLGVHCVVYDVWCTGVVVRLRGREAAKRGWGKGWGMGLTRGRWGGPRQCKDRLPGAVGG